MRTTIDLRENELEKDNLLKSQEKHGRKSWRERHIRNDAKKRRHYVTYIRCKSLQSLCASSDRESLKDICALAVERKFPSEINTSICRLDYQEPLIVNITILGLNLRYLALSKIKHLPHFRKRQFHVVSFAKNV